MLSLLAIVSLLIGALLYAALVDGTTKGIAKEVGRMMMWCGFLVLLALAAGWHAVPLH